MVTTISRETETETTTNANVNATAGAVVLEPITPAAAPVDVSAVPETPAELLQQWVAPRRQPIHTRIAAAFVRIWDAITGPGMTNQARANRDIAEHNGHVRHLDGRW